MNTTKHAPAQTLPYPLLLNIWKYYIYYNKPNDGSEDELLASYATFLSVCQTWRETTQSEMYRHLFLHLKSHSEQVVQSIYRENKHTDISKQAVSQYTRNVHISIDIDCLFGKGDMQKLVEMPVLRAISKNHLSVIVSITRNAKANNAPHDTSEDHQSSVLDQLAQFIATFAGENQHLEIHIAELSELKLSETQCSVLSKAVFLLLESKLLLKALVADSYFVDKVDYSSFKDLCKLDLALPNSEDNAFALVHSNASSLQFLKVRMDEYTGFEPFVRDSSKGQLITYAQLNELVVMSSPEDQPTKRLTFDKEYIPFPKLKRADFTQIAYPFGDDTLFRGNKATLEHVGMPLDNNLAVVLAGNQRDNPAVLANYKALYKLEINGNVNEVVADDEEASDYAYAISANFLPHVKSMTIADIDLSGIFLDLISRQTWFTQMQVLRLKMYPISVQEVLPMLNILPLLRVFESGVSELGHMLSHVPEELLPKYVQSMGPVHPNLKEWQIYQASNIDEALLDTCTNLLTIKCPHVKIVEVGASDDDYLIDI